MSMPMPPEQEQEGPISFDLLMKLRNAARTRMGQPEAAARRLAANQESGPMEMGTDPRTGVLAEGQTPEEMVISDIQNQMDAEIEPPDIPNTAANTMMRYGAIQEYLMRARGELPNA